MNQDPVKIYTTSYCPFCVRAKNFFKSKGIPFEEINMDGKDQELESLKKKTGLRTVPQIFIGENLVGGFTDLAELDAKGELEAMISSK